MPASEPDAKAPAPSEAPTLTAASAIVGASSAQRADPVLHSGQDFGPYRIERLLGRGGMGEVYAAEESATGRRLAIKILGQRLTEAAARERFLREGRLAASLSHPNTVYVFGTDEIEGRPVIAMELTEGGNLDALVKDGGPLTPTKAVDAILQVVAGLNAAAEAGVLHRDVKPSNCFVELDGTIKVGDFGLSISATARDESQLTTEGTFLGTPAFASPEQLRGDELDTRSDLYSVGATLYFLLTGRAPFDGATVLQVAARALNEKPEPPHAIRRDVPRALSALVLRCLAKKPEERFAGYPELTRWLEEFSSVAPIPSRPSYRFAAGVLDYMIVPLLLEATRVAMGTSEAHADLSDGVGQIYGDAARFEALSTIVFILYYALSEGMWGGSPGKLVLGLRVTRTPPGPVGWTRALARSALLFGTASLAAYAIEAAGASKILWPFYVWAGLGLMFTSAREGNGYRGVHELLSKTRVVSVRTRRPMTSTASSPSASPPPLVDETKLATLGPYHLVDGSDDGLVEAWDARLRRRVWIWQANQVEPVSAARRNLRRLARPRWLTGKRTARESWDAYEHVSGAPFLTVAREPKAWDEVRYWLHDLAREMASGLEDSTLPAVGLDRVWIGADGKVRLLDWPVSAPRSEPERERYGVVPPPVDAASFQGFLSAAARAALVGTTDSAGVRRKRPVLIPLSARSFLEGLDQGAYPSPREIENKLTDLLNRPAVISFRRLSTQLGLFVLGFELMIASTLPAERLGLVGRSPELMTGFLFGAAAVGVTFATLLRGGVSMRVAGIAVVDATGRQISLLRALGRSLLTFIPVLGLAVATLFSESSVVSGVIATGSVAALLSGLICVAVTPRRRLQDRIAGTYLVLAG